MFALWTWLMFNGSLCLLWAGICPCVTNELVLPWAWVGSVQVFARAVVLPNSESFLCFSPEKLSSVFVPSSKTQCLPRLTSRAAVWLVCVVIFPTPCSRRHFGVVWSVRGCLPTVRLLTRLWMGSQQQHIWLERSTEMPHLHNFRKLNFAVFSYERRPAAEDWLKGTCLQENAATGRWCL